MAEKFIEGINTLSSKAFLEPSFDLSWENLSYEDFINCKTTKNQNSHVKKVILFINHYYIFLGLEAKWIF